MLPYLQLQVHSWSQRNQHCTHAMLSAYLLLYVLVCHLALAPVLLFTVLQHLELFLVNVACDDPGAAIGSQLVLPLLQERLDAAALEFKAERAKMAEEEIIAMEVRTAMR